MKINEKKTPYIRLDIRRFFHKIIKISSYNNKIIMVEVKVDFGLLLYTMYQYLYHLV